MNIAANIFGSKVGSKALVLVGPARYQLTAERANSNTINYLKNRPTPLPSQLNTTKDFLQFLVKDDDLFLWYT